MKNSNLFESMLMWICKVAQVEYIQDLNFNESLRRPGVLARLAESLTNRRPLKMQLESSVHSIIGFLKCCASFGVKDLFKISDILCDQVFAQRRVLFCIIEFENLSRNKGFRGPKPPSPSLQPSAQGTHKSQCFLRHESLFLRDLEDLISNSKNEKFLPILNKLSLVYTHLISEFQYHSDADLYAKIICVKLKKLVKLHSLLKNHEEEYLILIKEHLGWYHYFFQNYLNLDIRKNKNICLLLDLISKDCTCNPLNSIVYFK